MEFNTPTFEEKLAMYIEHDNISGICSLINGSLWVMEIAENDEFLNDMLPTLIDEVKTANTELQKRLPKYIGNETTEGDLMEKLKALKSFNDTCVKDWYDEIDSFKTIKTRHIPRYMNKHIENLKYEFEKQPDRKKASAIALVYANEELLRRLDEVFTK